MNWARTCAIVDQSTFPTQGGYFAAKQRGNKVLDRPLETIWLDEPDPQDAQLNAQRLIDEHEVDALIGGAQFVRRRAMSGVAYAGSAGVLPSTVYGRAGVLGLGSARGRGEGRRITIDFYREHAAQSR